MKRYVWASVKLVADSAFDLKGHLDSQAARFQEQDGVPFSWAESTDLEKEGMTLFRFDSRVADKEEVA